LNHLISLIASGVLSGFFATDRISSYMIVGLVIISYGKVGKYSGFIAGNPILDAGIVLALST
jgi:hypothetical protein